jgi:patatin-related protein
MNVPEQPAANGHGAAKEEIRFAVVLNGGVSLAVWMGGVVREIDRVTREEGPYGRLLSLLNSQARADVIAGTSAGGINGAALALGQANQDAKVAAMRDLWSEQGRMDSLLQRPFRGSPASLLRGDDYFLPKLYEAMKQLCKPWESRSTAERPVELIITTTLLHGARTVSVDSLGQQLPQMLHQGYFTFKREGDQDDFEPAADHDIAAGLAIAARCTAGFPLAFEPCFVPARGPDGLTEPANGHHVDLSDAKQRPDLGRYVSWRTAGPAEAIPPDRSRYAVDGGLLANTPTQAALDAVARMPAGGVVQRVMLLVYPHAPVNRPDPADRADDPPTVAGAMGGLLGALLSQGNRTFVDEIEKHNQAASARRGTRLDILEGLKEPDELKRLAQCVYGQYRKQRVRRAARDLAARVEPPADWSYRRIRGAVETAQRKWLTAADESLPYVPRELPTEDGAVSPGTPYWGWGVTAALDVADEALDLLHRLISVNSDEHTCAELAQARWTVSKARADLHTVRDRMDKPWTEDPVLSALRPGANLWTLRLALYARAMVNDDSAVASAESDLMTDVLLQDRGAKHPISEQVESALRKLREEVTFANTGQAAAAAVDEIVKAVAGAIPPLKAVTDDRIARSAGLKPWQTLFADLTGNGEANRRRVLTRLLWLHVAAWTLAEDSSTGSSHPVDLVQISLQTENPFAKQSTTLEDKVGGMSLNRFGGFLKRSWRMNDWTWGRMDAATMLCQVILSPERLRRRAIQSRPSETPETATQFVDTLIQDLFGTSAPAEVLALRDDAIREVSGVYSLTGPDLPASLPNLAAIAAWAVHLRVAVEELPTIAAAVAADRSDHANPSSKGELFLTQYSALLTELDGTAGPEDSDPLSADEAELGSRALQAFDRAGIGREPLEEEARSDQLIRTAATAASVAVTVADSNRSGLGAIKPVTRTLRGGMMVPYWTVLGLAAGGAIMRFLALLTLALGGLLLALSLVGGVDGWAAGPATAIGVGAVLTAFGFAALRTGTLLHSVVLLTPVIPLVGFAVDGWRNGDAGSDRALGVAGTIVALVLALMLLGSLPSQVSSPIATAYRVLDKRVRRYFGDQVVMEALSGRQKIRWRLAAGWVWSAWSIVWLAAVAAVIYVLVRIVVWIDDHALQWRTEHGWIVAVAVVLVLAGWAVGYWTGWRLRSWAEISSPAGVSYQPRGVSYSSGVAATWSVIYGTVYAVIAAGVLWHWPDQSSWVWRSALTTAVVFALLLLYVVPVAVLVGSVQSVCRRLVKDTRNVVITWPGADANESDVVNLLLKQDVRFRCLLKPSTPQATALVLTGAGHRLRNRVNKDLATGS